jgi:hypothetical protein
MVPHKPFIPLEFPPSVSPRLATHSLLHSLIRVGLTVKAYRLADSLIKSGAKMRPRSIEVVIHGLLRQKATPPPDSLKSYQLDNIAKIITSSKVLTLNPRLVADQTTRYAIRLILRTRHHRQRCSAEAYGSIIRYLLQRAEILVASLVFGTMVKDYQVKQTLAARLREQIRSVGAEEESGESSALRKAELQSRLKDVLWQKPVMEPRLARNLVESIEGSMVQDSPQETNEVSLCISLQALANIAMLLDERCLPNPEVASIIRVLYSCPRSNIKVWIVRDGEPYHTEAYSYFHSVLLRLVSNPPMTKPSRRLGESDTPNSPMPYMDLDSCNALLHYALRHRQDPALAKKVLYDMRNRPKPLEPNIVTYNILIRSGTLLRKAGITEAALHSLRQNVKNAQHGIMIEPPAKGTPTQPEATGAENLSRSPTHDVRGMEALSEEMSQLHNEQASKQYLLTADGHTLTSYIMHLTASGNPHVVADVLFHVLPELAMIEHPSWGSMTFEQAKSLRKSRIKARREHLRRAASFGPHFFTAILNALRKSGKTGLTERVWLLAKQAERISWTADNISPWLLPVAAYTIMLQCYAAEARKGLGNGLARRKIAMEDDQHHWQPSTQQYVRGWARFVLAQRIITHRTPRASAARWTGMQLYHSMRNGGHEVFNDLIRLKAVQKGWHISIPKPDARFFNAALDLFTRDKTRRRLSPSQWKRKVQRAQLRYAQTGSTSKMWDPLLLQVVQEMIACGISVPIALRPKFLGRIPSHAMFQAEGRALDQRPFIFPPIHKTFRPYSVPTVKTRGMPVRRRRSRPHSSRQDSTNEVK